MHVGPEPPIVPQGFILPLAYTEVELEQFTQTAQKMLDEQIEKIEAAGGNVTHSHLRMGEAAQEIVDLGEEIGAGLIVVGSRGLSGMRWALIGSVSDSIVRYAHCPVLVVRKEERPPRSGEVRPTVERAPEPLPQSDAALRASQLG